MLPLLNQIHETVAPSEADTQLAQESTRQLAKFLGGKNGSAELYIRLSSGEEEAVAIPVSAFRLLANILSEMARGNAVTLIPVHAELAIHQAADFLNVSLLFLMELLEKGAIPFHTIGTQRRILFQDLRAYKQRTDQKRLEALEELSALDQELGFGYGP